MCCVMLCFVGCNVGDVLYFDEVCVGGKFGESWNGFW